MRPIIPHGLGSTSSSCPSPRVSSPLSTGPAGWAVVFSCSLLHEATPVTAGKRYAFLPFLYDDEAARIRQQNLAFLGEGQTGDGNANKSSGGGEAART